MGDLVSKKHGKGTEYYPDGTVYTGTWHNGAKTDQHGDLKSADTSHYLGGIQKGLRQGVGTQKYAKDGASYIGGWLNNKRHGQGQLNYKNGDKYIGEFAQDEFNG